MRKSRIATVVGAAAAATMLTISTAFAVDGNEVASATSTTSNGPWECAYHTTPSYACFAEDGDWFKIADLDKDGNSQVAQWYLVRPADDFTVRAGAIWNTDGYLTTRYKNKDFAEGYIVHWRVCDGNWGTKDIYENSCGAWVIDVA